MKDQTNLIVSIVAIVFAIGFALVFMFTARQPMSEQKVTAVPVSEVKPAEGAVVYANSLPGGSSNASAGGASGQPAGGAGVAANPNRTGARRGM